MQPRNCRVLLVEAREPLCELLVAIIAPEYEVVPVDCEAAALAALGRTVFQVALIEMELMTGDSLSLATTAARQGCGVILIPDTPAQFYAAAAAGHLILSKPFRCKRVLQLVEEARSAARIQLLGHRSGRDRGRSYSGNGRNPRGAVG
jgi:DNA-binding NtrC family response regulator